MRVVKNRRVTEPKLIGITCDICGKSCREGASMKHEMACLQAAWGYMSRKGGSNWCCDMCENCADKVKAFIESIGGKIIETNYI